MVAEIVESKAAKKDLDKAPMEVVQSYEIWARLVEEHGKSVLKDFKGYHDEKLSDSWKGYHSSRLNRKWRVIYDVQSGGKLQIIRVVRVTAHDYRRKK